MVEVILTTAPLVKSFSRYEELFYFYDDGIKGIIENYVKISHVWLRKFFEDHRKTSESMQLMDDILMQYENSLWRRMMENTYTKCCPTRLLESIIDEIECEVDLMMSLLTDESPFQVKKVHGWVGDDLAITLSPMVYA